MSKKSISLKKEFNKTVKKTNTANKTNTEKPILPFKLVGNKKDHPRLIKILNRLCQSEFGYEQAKIACENGFTLGFANSQGAVGVCDKAGSYITLNPNFSDDKLVGTLSHECRHAGQFARGGDENFGVENIKSEIIKFRALEADAEMANVVACFELFQKGDKRPLIEFSNKSPFIYKAFVSALEKEKGVLNNNVKTAAFLGWYDNTSTKYSYERSYHVAFMAKFMKENALDKYPYSKNITSEEEINRTCFDKNGNYFTGNKNILGEGKFIDVSPDTKMFFEKYFDLRKERYGIDIDPTLKDIPARNHPYFLFHIESFENKNHIMNPRKEFLTKGASR